jgi:predicted  nucleic acid-binding Zn-ribbon protein
MSVLEQLINLHRVDSQLRGLRARLDGAERLMANQEKLLATLERQHAELEMQRKQLQARVAAMEVEAKALDERVERLRHEANSQQTHRAYTALQTELGNLKSDRSNMDSRSLADMEQIDKLAEEVKKIEQAMAERQRVRDVAAKECEERRLEVGDRLDELGRERADAVAGIPEATMDLFNRIGRMYEGEALASIEEIDRRSREYACASCNVHLPFEAISKLLSPGGAVVQCPGCRRILYLQQETRTAITRK